MTPSEVDVCHVAPAYFSPQQLLLLVSLNSRLRDAILPICVMPAHNPRPK